MGVCMPVLAWSLDYQHATHTQHTVMSFVAHLTPPYFSTLSHKWHTFEKKKFLNVKGVF
jgi:hypothetical protein